MIALDRVTLTMPAFRERVTPFSKMRPIFSDLSLTIPSHRRIALLSPSPEDQVALIDLLGGVIVPRAGRVVKEASVSFPLGHLGSFDMDLSVRKNVEHLARLYDADVGGIVAFVAKASGLGASWDEPYGRLSGADRVRIGTIVGYTLPFDTYLLAGRQMGFLREPDDIINTLFNERFATSGMIVGTSNVRFALERCEMALLLHDGRLDLFETVEQAVELAGGEDALRPGRQHRSHQRDRLKEKRLR